MFLILILNAFPLIEVSIFFLALFYTLHIKPTFKMILLCVAIIFLPSIALLLLGVKLVFIAYLTISALIIFSYFTKSLRAFIDLCSLVFGGILAEHIAYRISFLLVLEQPILTYIYISIFFIAFTIFTYYYKKFILKMHPTTAFSLKARRFIIFTSCLTIFLMYLNISLPIFHHEIVIFRINLALELIYLLCMFVIYRTSAKGIKIKNELERLEIELEQHMVYMKSLEKINKEMQKFQHDYANILLTIRGYLEIEDLQGLKHYFQTHILKAEQKTFFKNEVFSNLDNLKIVELKGLLATKVIHADQLGIKLSVEIPEEITSIDMDIIDLTRIIGILTDNAIEACIDKEDHEICIGFMKTYQQFHPDLY